MHEVAVGDLKVGNDCPLTLIAGPCQIEGLDHSFGIATALKNAAVSAGAGLIFKASFDKANRTSISGERGPGLEAGLEILAEIKRTTGLPVLTDVHLPDQCARVAEVVDVLQIPAFLCRQTDLLLAAGETGAALNIKKGQFLAPWDMDHVISKVTSTGNQRLMLTERGTTFGYNALVVDVRSLPRMAQTGYPVVMDATHAVQEPGSQGASTGGQRRFVAPLARAAVSQGIAGVFLETHPDPDVAPSDGPNTVPLDRMPALIDSLMAFDRLAKSDPIRI